MNTNLLEAEGKATFFLMTTVLAGFTGLAIGSYTGEKRMEDEAVKRGVAERVLNQVSGEIEFRWKD